MKSVFYINEQEIVDKYCSGESRSSLAPVIIYVYNRVDKIKNCIDALLLNYLANEVDLFVISDGPHANDVEAVNSIRSYLADLTGFRSINVLARQSNWGATKSTSSAEHLIGSLYQRFIAMEDDNIVSKNFLNYMNQALDYYKHDSRVFSICGYKAPFNLPENYSRDVWFSPWHNAWTYATWYDRWSRLDIESNDFSETFKSISKRKRLRELGLFMYDAAWLDWKGFARANDARICMHMFHNAMVTVAPSVSLNFNDGQDGTGLHAKKTSRFEVDLSNGEKINFNFVAFDQLDDNVISMFVKFMDRGFFYRTLRCLGFMRIKYIIKSMRLKMRMVFDQS